MDGCPMGRVWWEEDMSVIAHQGATQPMAGISKLKIKLEVTGVQNGFAIFTLDGEDNDDKKHVKNKKIIIPSGSRNVTIEFKLMDRSGNDLEFDQSEPIWVSRADLCPQSFSSDPQISVGQVQASKLAIEDQNTENVELGYTLVLQGSSGRVLADPIIKNDP
jgi:hypothetical protein